jgi:Cupin domain
VLFVQAEEKSFNASAGDFVYTPHGTIHWFKNIGKTDAKMLVCATPAGLEKFFEETFDPAVDRFAAPPPASQAMLARFMAAAPRYGLEIVNPGQSADAH